MLRHRSIGVSDLVMLMASDRTRCASRPKGDDRCRAGIGPVIGRNPVTASCQHPLAQFAQPLMLDDLSLAELLVTTATRAWFDNGSGEHRPVVDWRTSFTAAGVAPAGALGFHLLLSVLARCARPPQIQAYASPFLGIDEVLLLRLIATMQRDDVFGAIGGLATWLPEQEFAAALRGGQSLAQRLLHAGLILR